MPSVSQPQRGGGAAAPQLWTPLLSELLAHEFPPRPTLLSPWLREGDATLLYARTGVGKSLLAASIALAVAGGGSCLGWRAETAHRVAWFDGEQAGDDIAARFAMLLRAVPGCDAGAAGENLMVFPKLSQDASARFPDIADDEGQRDVMRLVRDHGASLVVFDNLGCLGKISDENSAVEVQPICELLLRLKAAGIAVVLIHHGGKRDGNFRGSSALEAPIDVTIGLERVDRAAGVNGAAFRLKWGKLRHRPDVSDMTARLQDGRWMVEGSSVGTREPDANIAALIAAASSGAHASQRELAAALGCSPSTVNARKAAAIRDGHFTEVEWNAWMGGGGGRRGAQ